MEGVTTNEAQIHTSEKTVMPLNPIAHSAYEMPALPSEETRVPVTSIQVTPDSALEDASPTLPDLVTETPQNKNTASEHAIPQIPITGTNVMLNNTSEFDFPPISSDEENLDCNGTVAPLVSQEKEFTETQLTEEEGDVVNALLSLSRSLPSNGEEDTENTENSELMPIGKPTFDVAPVPIRLSSDDVNVEITRLNLCESDNDTADSQANPISTTTSTTTMTTIVTRCTDRQTQMHMLSLMNSVKLSVTIKSSKITH